ncbi:MAG: hypothetical protein IPO81_28780 [Kouleothrix sp.]|nr:hypothetical protein [Kouleothrix sp.]
MRISALLSCVVAILGIAGGLIYFSLATADDAVDSFSRNVTGGWGSAGVGGQYSIAGAAGDFVVDGAAGTIALPAAGVPHSAYLLGVSALNVDMTFRVQTDKPAAGGSQMAYLVARLGGNGSAYLGRLRLAADGSVRLQAVRELNATVSLMGAERVVPGAAHAPNSAIWLRGQVVGANPTIIRLKAWPDGQPEPSIWLYSVTDSAPDLQTAGALGLRTYLAPAATNAPVVFRIDDFRVTSVAPPSADQASDRFSRTVAGGWGSARLGGAYSLAGPPADFAVDGSVGRVTLSASNTARSAYLASVSALDIDISVRVRIDRPAAGGSPMAYLVARRGAGVETGYLGRLRLAADGSVRLQAVREISGTATLLGTEKVVPGVAATPDGAIWLRGQVVGTNPATIRLKAWADGRPEPAAWVYSVADSAPDLQAAGAVGLRAYLAPAATNVPVVFSFDDLLVTSVSSVDGP